MKRSEEMVLQAGGTAPVSPWDRNKLEQLSNNDNNNDKKETSILEFN